MFGSPASAEPADRGPPPRPLEPPAEARDENPAEADESASPPNATPEQPEPGDREPSSRVWLAPTPPEAAVGDVLTVRVMIESNQSVASVPFHLSYDRQRLVLLAAEEGSFLAADGHATAFLAAPRESADTIVVGLSRLGDRAGVSGFGELCRLQFRAVAPGTASLAFERATARDTSNRTLETIFEPLQIAIR
ncbi:MAG: hypothetical protein JSV80_05810 [Acidobacteriota bacterium]|nr:MAG: hypothetical protein JSV80_05810 [Acidobacteriota bacterium]